MRFFLLGVLAALPCFPQMTVEQRLFDFEHVASQFAKFYAPYEWKKELLGFDLYNIAPWLDRVRNAKSDLEYYEIASEYVAALNDTHSKYYIPSDFLATIGIRVDIYDGKFLIDSVTRSQLPLARYPFTIGDEIVSVDGKTPEELVTLFSRFEKYGNERATRRWAADNLFYRDQSVFPRAHEIGDNASVVVRRAASGELETYQIPWIKRGTPVISAGPLPNVFAARPRAASGPTIRDLLARYQTRKLRVNPNRTLGLGSRTPFFTLPAGFQRRLGTANSHFHFSGIFTSEGKRIGYLRIPHFDPPNYNAAYFELASEIDFLERNTDGLVVDIARNTGGTCYGQDVAQLLIPRTFQAPIDEVRPSRSDLMDWEFALNSPPPAGFEQWELDLAKSVYTQLATAYSENRGRTGPLQSCSLSADVEPLRNRDGSVFAYTKPLILLIDEFSISWADSFAQIFSDTKRGPLFGYRTNGAGGAVVGGFAAGFHSEAELSVTITIGVRAQSVQQPGYPSTRYYENVGIWPDIPYDVMTVENLTTGYAPYVQAFTKAILDEINKEAK